MSTKAYHAVSNIHNTISSNPHCIQAVQPPSGGGPGSTVDFELIRLMTCPKTDFSTLSLFATVGCCDCSASILSISSSLVETWPLSVLRPNSCCSAFGPSLAWESVLAWPTACFSSSQSSSFPSTAILFHRARSTSGRSPGKGNWPCIIVWPKYPIFSQLPEGDRGRVVKPGIANRGVIPAVSTTPYFRGRSVVAGLCLVLPSSLSTFRPRGAADAWGIMRNQVLAQVAELNRIGSTSKVCS